MTAELDAPDFCLLAAHMREAVEQTRLAYKFTSSSYTFHALRACLAALRHIEEQAPSPDVTQHIKKRSATEDGAVSKDLNSGECISAPQDAQL